MTDLLTDMKAYFVANGIQASLIFRDGIPDKPDTAIALFEYEGSSPGAQIAGSDRSVQVMARALSSDEAKVLARKLHKLLETEDGELYYTPERWSITHRRQSPFKLKVDDAKRSCYVFNVGITTYDD
jgi:hypothetical protein